MESGVIWKYPLVLADKQSLVLPKDAKFLHVAVQDGGTWLWALVLPDNPTEARFLRIIGTGNPVEYPNDPYIGTVHTASGFVWHIFEAWT